MFLASKHNLSFAIIFVTVLQNFAKMKLPISFAHNFKTGHVLNFAKVPNTELAAFRRVLI